MKEVLGELSEMEFPAKISEVVIEGYRYGFDGYNDNDIITLIKTIGFLEPLCYNVLEIYRKTSTLFLNTIEDDDANMHYRLCGHKAHEAFIIGDFENYLNKEDLYYNDD